MNTKITSELDLGSVVFDFAEAHGIAEDQVDACGQDRTCKGSVTFTPESGFADRCEIVSTKTEKVSNKYNGIGGWVWQCGDQTSDLGKKLLLLMAELNGEAKPSTTTVERAVPEGIAKTRDLEVIAANLNTIGGFPRAGYFGKAAEPRLYLDIGTNTKKMKSKVWLTVDGDKVNVNARVTCEDRNGFEMPRAWCENEERPLITAAEEIAAYVARHLLAPSGDQLAEVEQVMKDETLLDTVYGVTPEWRETRVAINRFGKLATRNRLFLILWKGQKINAPRKLEEISDTMYELASKKWPNGEKMCQPEAQSEAIGSVLGWLANEVVEVERATNMN